MLRQDFNKDPKQALANLKQRSFAGAKKLAEYGIKNIDKLDKVPHGKLIVGIAAAGLSIPTAGLSSALWKAVSTAALSRRSYQKQMKEALDDFAYNQFVESKQDYYTNTLLPKWKKEADAVGKDFNPISLEDYVKLNLKYPKDTKYLAHHKKLTKEKEEFVSKITMSDFEAGSSYKKIKNIAIGLSLTKGLIYGALMPGVIKEFIDSPAFDFIKDKVADYIPGATKEQVRAAVKAVAASAAPLAQTASEAARAVSTAAKAAPSPYTPSSAPGGAAAPTPAPAASTPQAAAPTPSPVAAPVAPPAVSAPTLPTNFPITDGDYLEKIMKDHLPILKGLTPRQQESVIYNFFNTTTGDAWKIKNGITNINNIFTDKTLNLQSLDDAIKATKFTRSDGTLETLLARAKAASTSKQQ